MKVPENVFEMSSKMWQPIEEDESLGRQIQYISTIG
jgi:hypothetical protein